jgi:hypothetical protein
MDCVFITNGIKDIDPLDPNLGCYIIDVCGGSFFGWAVCSWIAPTPVR